MIQLYQARTDLARTARVVRVHGKLSITLCYTSTASAMFNVIRVALIWTPPQGCQSLYTRNGYWCNHRHLEKWQKVLSTHNTQESRNTTWSKGGKSRKIVFLFSCDNSRHWFFAAYTNLYTIWLLQPDFRKMTRGIWSYEEALLRLAPVTFTSFPQTKKSITYWDWGTYLRCSKWQWLGALHLLLYLCHLCSCGCVAEAIDKQWQLEALTFRLPKCETVSTP